MNTLPETPKPLNTPEIKALLRRRFDPGEYSLFWEVGDGRRADAVAINQWGSRGHAIHGFEIKAHRSDWLRELKQPAKPEVVMAFCDHWWLVAPKGVLVDQGELPVGWGYLEARPTGLHQQVRAPKLTPKPINRRFMALCLRRAAADDEAIVQARVRTMLEPIEKEHREALQRRQDAVRRESGDYRARYEKLAAEVGGLDGFGDEQDQVKKAIAIIRHAGISGTYSGLRGLVNTLASTQRKITEALKEFGDDEPV